MWVSSSGSFFKAFSFFFVEYVFPNDDNLFFWQRFLLDGFLFDNFFCTLWLFWLKVITFCKFLCLSLSIFTLIHSILLLNKLKRCLFSIFLFTVCTFLWAITCWAVTARFQYFHWVDTHWVVYFFSKQYFFRIAFLKSINLFRFIWRLTICVGSASHCFCYWFMKYLKVNESNRIDCCLIYFYF